MLIETGGHDVGRRARFRLLIEILDNRPDVATGERMMMGARHQTYPTIPVRWAEPDPGDPTGDRVTVYPTFGGRCSMTRHAFRTVCYLADA